MADQNVFSGFADGMQDGANWAAKQTELDLSKQRLAQQEQEHAEVKRQFNSKLGRQYFEDLSNAAGMKSGPAKKAYIKRIQDDSTQAGIPLDPVLVSALDDPNYQPAFDKIYTTMTNGVQPNDPEMFNEIMSNLVPALGQKGALDAVVKMAENSSMLTKAAMEAKAKKLEKETAENRFNQKEDRIERATAQRTHNQVVAAIKNNPQLRTNIGRLQGLDNALSIITDSKKVGPQQLHEFQQAIRKNLVSGTSGVEERAETYFKTLGLDAADWMQYLTGQPADLAKNSELVEHLKDVAATEKNNIVGQIDTQIDSLAEGQGHIYAQYPDMKKSLQSLVTATKGRIVAPKPENPTPTAETAPAKTEAPKTPPTPPSWIKGRSAFQEATPDERKDFLKSKKFQGLSPEARAFITGG